MALTITNSGGGSGGGIFNRSSTRAPSIHPSLRQHVLFPLSNRTVHIVRAKKLSSRTGRFDSSRKRRGATTIKEEEEVEEAEEEYEQWTTEIDRDIPENSSTFDDVLIVDDVAKLPELPGDTPDFWEGSQWDPLGFFVQYLWAFGIVFALVACGIAVTTYNEGATDFKETPAYKESVQSRDLLEEPETSNPDVFESNPTEVAPSLE